MSGSMMKSAKKPFEDGLPFGSYVMELKVLEVTKEKGQKGEWREFYNWHIQVVKKCHDSAQGAPGTLLKLRRDFSSDFGISDNTAIAAGFANKTFEEFQALPDVTIDAFLLELRDEKTTAEKHRQIGLDVMPDAKGYRRYAVHLIGAMPEKPFIFDAANFQKSQEERKEATAAGQAAGSTAAKPPASGL